MKIVLIILLSLPAKADYLSDIFNSSYDDKEECTCPTYDNTEGEVISWEDMYLNEYPQGVEVIYVEE
jgi:hypothetical protein